MTRGFTGSRDGTSTATILKQIQKIERQKGGKLPLTSTERYKFIMNKRLEQSRAKSQASAFSTFSLNGAKQGERQMSKRAELALKEIAQQKAAKEAKALRQMVVIKPQRYGDVGHINAKGIIYDQANNLTMKVDVKTGKIKTMNGWTVGKYKPKGAGHNFQMQTWIKLHSPYHIKMRQMEIQRQMLQIQQMQQAEMLSQQAYQAAMAEMQRQMAEIANASIQNNARELHDAHGNVLQSGGRTNMGVGAWGVRSNNVFGTFGDNVHGGFAENVWGTTHNNVWGGIGDTGGLFKTPGRSIWTSGAARGQRNLLGAWFSAFLARAGMVRRAPPSRGGRR